MLAATQADLSEAQTSIVQLKKEQRLLRVVHLLLMNSLVGLDRKEMIEAVKVQMRADADAHTAELEQRVTTLQRDLETERIGSAASSQKIAELNVLFVGLFVAFSCCRLTKAQQDLSSVEKELKEKTEQVGVVIYVLLTMAADQSVDGEGPHPKPAVSPHN